MFLYLFYFYHKRKDQQHSLKNKQYYKNYFLFYNHYVQTFNKNYYVYIKKFLLFLAQIGKAFYTTGGNLIPKTIIHAHLPQFSGFNDVIYKQNLIFIYENIYFFFKLNFFNKGGNIEFQKTCEAY